MKCLFSRVAALFLVLVPAGSAMAQPAAPLVLAAASLQESLNAAADDWARRGHRRPVLSFAASASLARQVEAGAPADLFISADEEWMDHVAGQNRLRVGTRADFVTNALALVARGEAPLGIVYATDALAEPKLRVVGTFPPASHEPIRYPLALLATSSSPDAEPFRRFLLSGAGRAIFRKFGFGTP